MNYCRHRENAPIAACGFRTLLGAVRVMRVMGAMATPRTTLKKSTGLSVAMRVSQAHGHAGATPLSELI